LRTRGQEAGIGNQGARQQNDGGVRDSQDMVSGRLVSEASWRGRPRNSKGIIASSSTQEAETNVASPAHEKIDAMVRRIVERFDPEKIILFGSHARRTAGPDSEVDLLVVMPVRGSKRDTRIEIRRALHKFRIPKDIAVTTPEDFAWRQEIPGTIERPAALEGKVVYARA
jgi:predicted nucleotidyltransferase